MTCFVSGTSEQYTVQCPSISLILDEGIPILINSILCILQYFLKLSATSLSILIHKFFIFINTITFIARKEGKLRRGPTHHFHQTRTALVRIVSTTKCNLVLLEFLHRIAETHLELLCPFKFF